MSDPSPDPDDGPTAGDRTEESSAAPTDQADEPTADPSDEFNWGESGKAVDDRDDADSDAVDGTGPTGGGQASELPFGVDFAVGGVIVISVLALLARFVALGARPAHFDEARVAYWALYTQETGNFAYRAIVHGPFIQHFDRLLFGVFEANDFVMRIPPALIGGLFPLSALLFRNQLRDEETVAVAFFLAFNPVLLYYSRFMRSDVLVAAFMFTALGFLVRFAESRRPRYLYGVAVFGAFGIASKENALLYILTWLGAAALVVDRALDRPGSDTSGTDRLVSWGSSARSWLGVRAKQQHRRRVAIYGLQVLGAVVVFGLVWLWLFAPRGDGLEGLKTLPDTSQTTVGLWQAVGDPGQWPALFDATYSQFTSEYLAFGDQNRGLTFESYQQRLGDMIQKGIVRTSIPLVLFGIAGFVRERYASVDGRVLVFFLFYAAVASLVGYPLGLSIGSGWKWNLTHVLVPLSIPAAVGMGTVYRWGQEAKRDNDPVDLGLTAFILLLAVSTVAVNAMPMYTQPQTDENPIVQFAQPADDLDPMFEALQEGAGSPGTDVIVYSDPGPERDIRVPLVHDVGVDERWNVRPTCTILSHFLPAHWYVNAAGADADCARTTLVLQQQIQEEKVPVVITKVRDDTVPREWLRQRFTHVGNFSLRYTERADPTLEVWSRTVEDS